MPPCVGITCASSDVPAPNGTTGTRSLVRPREHAGDVLRRLGEDDDVRRVARVVAQVARVVVEHRLAGRNAALVPQQLNEPIAHTPSVCDASRTSESDWRARRRGSTGSTSTPAARITRRVHAWVRPELFRVPGFRRYHGYALWRTIVVESTEASDDLLTHELCHVWQAQRRPLTQLWAWLRYRYRENPFEREARAAVDATRNG